MFIPQEVIANLPCKDEESAALFAAYINGRFDEWASVEGRYVKVKTTDVTAEDLLAGVVYHATEQYWTQGAEMTLAMAEFLDSLAR